MIQHPYYPVKLPGFFQNCCCRHPLLIAKPVSKEEVDCIQHTQRIVLPRRLLPWVWVRKTNRKLLWEWTRKMIRQQPSRMILQADFRHDRVSFCLHVKKPSWLQAFLHARVGSKRRQCLLQLSNPSVEDQSKANLVDAFPRHPKRFGCARSSVLGVFALPVASLAIVHFHLHSVKSFGPSHPNGYQHAFGCSWDTNAKTSSHCRPSWIQ
mmetsp:Transcript_26692/g.73612  ORF Transcript_26692/g.73612 Transcript_26692/m.73612 type:complete len:209 (-) Transcript_26692:30-656(-)